MHQAEESADASFLGGHVLSMLLEQQGVHCGWRGVSGWGGTRDAEGDRSRSLVIEDLPKILGFCSVSMGVTDLCF